MFCARPFSQFYIVENGDVHLCCPEWIAMPAGNLFVTPPLEIWKGKVATRVRESILDKSFRFCINCPHLPGPSGCVVPDDWAEQPSIERIGMMTMAYDPTCNLACPSCRTGIRGKAKNSAAIQEIILASGILQHVDTFYTSGSGDPLASPLFWDFLKALPNQGCPNLKITLQTNGLLLTPKTWERLGEHAARISEIFLSVDAARPETYQINRGGSWKVLNENLAEIKRRGIPLQLNMVVQANNYKEMLEFVDFADSYGAYRIYFSALENWGVLSDADYQARAIHLSSHPEHSNLVSLLQHEKLRPSFKIVLARLPRQQ